MVRVQAAARLAAGACVLLYVACFAAAKLRVAGSRGLAAENGPHLVMQNTVSCKIKPFPENKKSWPPASASSRGEGLM